MKLLYQKLLLTAAFLFSIFSVTAQDEVLRHIPARTSQIVQVDLQRLQQFMKWEEILQLPSIEQLSKQKKFDKQPDEEFLEYLKNPLVTGIDLGSALYVFSHQSLENYADAFKGVGGKINNLQQFTAWVLKMNKAVALTKPGRVKTFIKDEVAFVWDTEHFVVIHDIAAKFNSFIPVDTAVLNSLKPLPGDTIPDAYAALLRFQGKRPAEPVTEEVIKSFNEDATTPAFDGRMLALFRQTEPLKVWNMNAIPGGKLGALFNPMAILSRAKQKEEKAGIITSASVLNFDNGRAFYSSRTYLDEELNKFFSNPSKQSFDVSMIQNAGLQKLVGFITLKINMQSLGELFADAIAEDSFIEKMKKDGLEPADLLAAFAGDVFVGCKHPGQEREDIPPSFVVAFKINNLPAAERVLNKIKEGGEERKQKKNEWFGMDEAKTMLIISTSKENAESFLAKSAGVVNDNALEEQVKANPLYLQLNVNELYNIMMRLEQPKHEREKAFAGMLGDIQQFKVTAGKFENGALLLDYELAFNNKEDNGFRQMMLMYDKLLRNIMSTVSEPQIMEMPKEGVIIDGKLQKGDIPAPPPPAMIEEMKIAIDQEGVKDEIVPPLPPVKRPHPKAKIKSIERRSR